MRSPRRKTWSRAESALDATFGCGAALSGVHARVRGNRVKNFLLSPHKRLLIKIIPHHTESIYKIEISHLHLAVTALCTGLLCIALMVSHVGAVHAAEAKVQTLQSVDAQQKKQLADMSKQTHSILLRLKLLQQSESEIRTLTGIGAKKSASKALRSPGWNPRAVPGVPLPRSTLSSGTEGPCF